MNHNIFDDMTDQELHALVMEGVTAAAAELLNRLQDSYADREREYEDTLTAIQALTVYRAEDWS
jgi:hypothetical protein